jgi:C4-dicarboxylate transporter DctQ subunit
MVSVVLSVVMRNIGYPALRLAVHLRRIRAALHDHAGRALAGARTRACAYRIGHRRLPEAGKARVSRLVALLCVAGLSLTLAWYGLELFLTNVERNDYDVRAYFYPRWLLTITFPVAFGLMAIEFAVRLRAGASAYRRGGDSRIMEWFEALALLRGQHHVSHGARHARGAGVPRGEHPRRLGLHGRRARHRRPSQQRLGGADDLRAGADPAVPADGRGLLPDGPRATHVQSPSTGSWAACRAG